MTSWRPQLFTCKLEEIKLNVTFLKNTNTIVDCNIDIAYQYNCFWNDKAIFNSKICQERNYFAKYYEEYITALSNTKRLV